MKYTTKREKWKNGYWIVQRGEDNKRIGWKKWSADKIKREKNYNIVKKAYSRKFWENKELSAFAQLKQTQQMAEKKTKLSNLTKKLDTKKLINIAGKEIAIGGFTKVQNLKKKMQSTLLKKGLSKKEANTLINNKFRGMTKRISWQIDVYSKQGYLGSLTLLNVNPEDEAKAKKFWINRQVDSNTFREHSNNFAETLKGNPKMVANPGGTLAGQVYNIQTMWTIV